MNNIEIAAKRLEDARRSFNSCEAELDEFRNKKTELKSIIADAKTKLDNWEALSPSGGVAAAMADRQSSRDLANQAEDARELLKVLDVDEQCHWLDLADAHAEVINASKELRLEYRRLVSAEINGRLEKVADKLRAHVGGLAELAAIKKIAAGEEAALAWAQAEFMKLLKPAMDNIDVNSVGVRMDIVAGVNEKFTTKYAHEIRTASSPGHRSRINHLKNRK